MGPVIAFRAGKPVFSVGAAGGSTIITTILQIILNHVDLRLSLPAALAAPRVSQTQRGHLAGRAGLLRQRAGGSS